MKNCLRCSKVITHHHSYCDDCYPQKTATILDLKKIIKEKDKEIHKLKNTIFNLKQIKAGHRIKELEKK